MILTLINKIKDFLKLDGVQHVMIHQLNVLIYEHIDIRLVLLFDRANYNTFIIFMNYKNYRKKWHEILNYTCVLI